MRKACVIGYPAKHSRSPLVHGYWLRQLGVSGDYIKAEVPPDAFTRFIAELPKQGFVGANVTIPHKQSAFALCAEATPAAKRLEAVNTIWLDGDRLYGDNTDGAGFLGALDQEAPGWDDRLGKAIVLGAGGAARAVVAALLSRAVSTLVVLNRTMARSAELAQLFGATVTAVAWDDRADALANADLLVNATSLGMAGQPALDLDLAALPQGAVVFDLVYVPLETSFLVNARARGLRGVGGLGMLLHQAVPGFERWFGRRPQVTAELRALIEADIRGES